MVVNCHELDLLNTPLIVYWLQRRFNAYFYYQQRQYRVQNNDKPNKSHICQKKKFREPVFLSVQLLSLRY